MRYDPGDGKTFWKLISRLPGYPTTVHEPIREMMFAPGGLFELPRVLHAVGASVHHPLLLVMDETPMRRGSEDLKSLVRAVLQGAGWPVQTVALSPDVSGQIHADMAGVEHVKSWLSAGASVLSVGSGTVTDIAKHACYHFQKESGIAVPFVVYQTANSVSAYTSNMAVIFTHGVKRTQESRYPDALVCDLETLRDAPQAMTVAGVGDLLAAFVSFPDWYLAHRLGMDPSYTDLPQALMGPLDNILLAEAEAIRTASLEGMATLAKLIALAGLAMSLSHATTPLSGFEHVMSHILDMVAEQSHLPLPQHGSQVGLAAIMGTEVYRCFLAQFAPAAVRVEKCYPEPQTMRAQIEATFATVDATGRMAAECWADYEIKLTAWHEHRGDLVAFLQDWPAIRTKVQAATRPPERLAAILAGVGAPSSFADLDPPKTPADVQFAFMNAPLMRRRLTIGDLLIFLGWNRQLLWKRIWQKWGKPHAAEYTRQVTE
jgi:glycerol-1-phosphate dehydrogenase [NAD(P)+]